MKVVITVVALALGSFAFSVMAQPPQRAAAPQASASQAHAPSGTTQVRKATPRAPALEVADPQARKKLGESRLCACVAPLNAA